MPTDDKSLIKRFHKHAQDLALQLFACSLTEVSAPEPYSSEDDGELIFDDEFGFNVTERHSRDASPMIIDPQILFETFCDDVNPEVLLLREACPLKRRGVSTYAFMHKSFQDYFVALHLIHVLKSHRRGFSQRCLIDWNHRFVSEDLLVLTFMDDILSAQSAQWQSKLQTRLMGILQYSKEHPEIAKASSSAISLLNVQRFSFSGKDLSHIQAPHAYLDSVNFYAADLSHAKLAHANLQRAQLAYANLSHANLQRTFWGQLPLIRHEHLITTLSISPDGRWFIAGDSFGFITKYSFPDSKVIWKKRGNGESRTIAATTNSSALTSYMPIAGDPSIKSSGISSNGERIIIAYANEIRLLDSETGERLGNPFKGHEDNVNTIAFSPRGEFILSGSDDKTLILWDITTQKPVGEPMKGHEGSVNSCDFSHDGKLVVSCSADKIIIVWSTKTLKEVRRSIEVHSDSINTVAFSPDAKEIVSGSSDSSLILWNTETLKPIGRPMVGHTNAVTCVDFSKDGRLISGSFDNTLRCWNPKNQSPLGNPLTGHTHWVDSVRFTPSGAHIISGSCDTTIRVWEVNHILGRGLHTDNKDSGFTVALCPKTNRMFSGSVDGTLVAWCIAQQVRIEKTLPGHTGAITAISISPDGSQIASGSADKTIRIWDAQRLTPIGSELIGHDSSVTCIAYSPDASQIVSGSHDKTLRLWDTKTRIPLGLPITGHCGAINAVAFSPNHKWIASGSDDKTIIIWERNTTPRMIARLGKHKAAITAIAFSPDSLQIVSGSRDNSLIIWDLNTINIIGAPLLEHISNITGLVFSNKGNHIISASVDGTLKVWDAATRERKQTIYGIDSPIRSLAINYDDEKQHHVIAVGCISNSFYVFAASKFGNGDPWTLIWQNHHKLNANYAITDSINTSPSCKKLIMQHTSSNHPLSNLLKNVGLLSHNEDSMEPNYNEQSIRAAYAQTLGF